MTQLTRRGGPLIAVALVAGAAALVGGRGDASAQDPGAHTIRFQESQKGATFTHIRNTEAAPRTANLQGDVLAATSRLVRGGKRIGTLEYSCVTTTGAKSFRKSRVNCAGIVTLADGTLAVQGLFSPTAHSSTAAITGGTGTYAGVTGEYLTGPSGSTIRLKASP